MLYYYYVKDAKLAGVLFVNYVAIMSLNIFNPNNS